jgi:hypothetical protein
MPDFSFYDTGFRMEELMIRNFKQYAGCLTLNDNEIKQYISPTINCTEEINMSSNTGSYNVSYLVSRSQYGGH